MVIREATINDRVSIAEIWRACFTDDENYIAQYLNLCLPHTITWILGAEEGRFYSCISILPSFFILDGERISGGYLYGVGTLPEQRGKSYSGILINKAVKSLRDKGYSYFLVKPATDSLFDLYTRLGFNNELYQSTYSQDFSNSIRNSLIWRYNKTSGEEKQLTASRLYKIREKLFSFSHFMWPLSILNYILKEVLNRDGLTLEFEKRTIIGAKKTIYLIGYPDISDQKGNTFRILESNASSLDDIEDIYSVLRHIGRKENIIKIDFPGFGNPVPDSKKEKSTLFMELKEGFSESIQTRHLSLPIE